MQAFDMSSVELLLETLPWFKGPYRALLEDYGEDLTPQVVFQELGELTGTMLVDGTDRGELLEAIFHAIEAITGLERNEAVEAVGLCFLGSLASEALDIAGSYLGPRTETMLLQLLDGSLEFEEDEPDEGRHGGGDEAG